MKIYRGYDQAGLDSQYNLRARWPEHADFVAAWAKEGAAALAAPGWRLELAYGPSAAQTLDLLAPPAAPGARAPLVVFFHGGYWQGLDKRDFAWLARALVGAGMAFATVNYGLAPTVGVDEIVRQARAALAWLWRNAPAFGCDPQRIFVAGHSAGGHLAAMLAATAWPRLGGLPAGLIAGAFSLSGVYDLEPIMLSYLNQVLKLDPGAVRRNSPLRLAPSTRLVTVAVGGLETPEFHRQQAAFVKAWRALGARFEVVDAPGLHHFDILAKLADPGHPIGGALMRLVRGESSPFILPGSLASRACVRTTVP